MGSSGSSDYSDPPRGPNPPSNMIIPQGGSAPLKTNFINFLGDPSQPSHGLTPDMLQQIMGGGNQQGGGPPNPAASADATAPPPAAAARNVLADLLTRGGNGGGARGAGSGGNGNGWGGH